MGQEFAGRLVEIVPEQVHEHLKKLSLAHEHISLQGCREKSFILLYIRGR